MTEFTRDIKPVDYSSPRIPAPQGGSVVADTANALVAGLNIYGDIKNKNRQAETEKLVGSLSSYETELSMNGVGKRETLRKVDERIRSMNLGSSQEQHLRTSYAQRRGSFVQRDIVEDENLREARREQQLDAEFNVVNSNAPQILAQYKRNPDGLYDKKDKIKAVQQFGEYRVREQQLESQRLIGLEELAQGKEASLQGALKFAGAVSGQIHNVYLPTSMGLVQTIGNMNLSSQEGIKLAEETLGNARNTFRVGKTSIESQFNSVIDGLEEGSPARKSLESSRDANLKLFDNIITTLDSTDVSKMADLTRNVEMIEKGLQLKGLENYSFVSMLEQLAPESGRFVVQKMIIDYPEIMQHATDEMAQGILSNMNPNQVVTQFAKEFEKYMKSGDTSKASDSVLKSFYGYARDTITNMPARDLSAGEIDKISGGLLGIMQEAAITDDPAQIKEATVLLNSPNFKEFFDQLPEERKAPMGRFISSFNQDVLIDPTDGLFTKLKAHTGAVGVSYDADKGEFVLGDTVEEKLPTGSLGFNITRRNAVKKDVESANLALKMIRGNSQYDPITQDSKKLIDTMIAEKLPKEVVVRGKLDVFTPEETTKQRTTEEETKIRTDMEILRNLNQEVDNLSINALASYPEYQQLLEKLNKAQGK